MAFSKFVFNATATFNGKKYVIGRFSREYICLKDLWDSVLQQTVGFPYIIGETFRQEVQIPWDGSVREISNDQDLLKVLDEFEFREVSNIHFIIYYLAINVMLPDLTSLPILGVDTDPNTDPNVDQNQETNTETFPDPIPDPNPEPNADPITETNPDPIPEPNQYLSPDRSSSETLYYPSSSSESLGLSSDATPDVLTDDVASSDEEFVPDQEEEERGSEGDDGLSDVDIEGFDSNADVFRLGENGHITLRVGQLFRNADHFRKTILDYSIQEGFKLRRIKNEKGRITSGCLSDGCQWRVHGSPTFDGVTYGLKTLRDEHTCLTVAENRDMTSTWIGEKFHTVIRENPDITVAVLGSMVLRQFGITVPYYTLRRAKNYALHIGEEDHKKSYDKLYRYGQTIRDRNSGSAVFLSLSRVNPDVNVPAHFNRFFLNFHAQKMGFLEGCRPFIGLDGCHLKGKYGGILLCAVGIDANSGVYPIALSVVEIESLDSWKWFLKLLYEHLGMPDHKTICFMSDRQKGIVPALDSVWPNHISRFCARHILTNMLSAHKVDYLKEIFWPAAKASNQVDFIEAIQKIKETSEKAWEYLMKIPKHRWTVHAFDHTTKTDHNTNNVVEAFNAWLNNVRALPMLTMFEQIRLKIMKRNRLRYDKAVLWDTIIPPKIKNLLRKIQQRGRYLDPIRCDMFEFEVKDNTRQYVVQLDKRLCGCGYWAVSGVPCMHALACITRMRGNVEDFLDDNLKRDAYLRTYSHVIHALPDESLWANRDYPTVLPPLKRNRPGRPKLSRNRGPEEPNRVKRSVAVRCRNCKEIGHNSRSCKNEPVPKKKKTSIAGTAGAQTSTAQTSDAGTSTAQTSDTGTSTARTSGGVPSGSGPSTAGTVTRVLWYGRTSSTEQIMESQSINPSAPSLSQSTMD